METAHASHPEAIGLRLEYRRRLAICPFEEVATHVPHDASVLELGCGYGLLANLVGLDSPSRSVIGIDSEPPRVAVAQRSTRGRAHVRFEVGDVTRMTLPQGGRLLIKDVDKSDALKYVWNYAHDLIKNRWLPVLHVLYRCVK